MFEKDLLRRLANQSSSSEIFKRTKAANAGMPKEGLIQEKKEVEMPAFEDESDFEADVIKSGYPKTVFTGNGEKSDSKKLGATRVTETSLDFNSFFQPSENISGATRGVSDIKKATNVEELQKLYRKTQEKAYDLMNVHNIDNMMEKDRQLLTEKISILSVALVEIMRSHGLELSKIRLTKDRQSALSLKLDDDGMRGLIIKTALASSALDKVYSMDELLSAVKNMVKNIIFIVRINKLDIGQINRSVKQHVREAENDVSNEYLADFIEL